jgi:two-component system, NtrC family, nitrogen regulation sensor histidine kinase NtrY
MPAITDRVTPGPARGRLPSPTRGRRPLRDNPLLILIGIIALIGALVGTMRLADHSSGLAPDFLTEFVLYALSVADLTMLVALVFVLARNIIKLVVERRRSLPFARFRAKLVAVLLAMTLIPAVLVLLVGSELIRNSVERWFNPPMDDILESASRIAADYHREKQLVVNDHAVRIARLLSPADLTAPHPASIRDVISPEVTQGRVQMVEVYRVSRAAAAVPTVVPLVDVASTTLPPGYSRAAADRLASRAANGSVQPSAREPLGDGGELIRAAAPIVAAGDVVGVVVTSDYLTGELAERSRRMTDAYEAYTQLRVLKRPLTGVYLSFFLMVTLMILVSATWMGLYLAKRITRPVQMLAAAAREIGAGHLDHRVERETADEFGSLVDAFNAMAGELAAGRRKLERSTKELQRKHFEVEARRRYIETILERVATGLVSVDHAGRIVTLNSAALRLLELGREAVGQPAASVFSRPDLEPLAALLPPPGARQSPPAAQEIALVRENREIHLAVAVTSLQGEDGSPEGAVLVLDDITPLIRSQKVAAWREVARRLAHEIKNPLTPIQLSAERLKRHFSAAPPAARTLVDECSNTIIGEVESLKGLVDEFSQFARMPPPRRAPADVNALLGDTLALYGGLFGDVRLETTFAPALPPVRLDPEQIRRVMINLIDNAVEAISRSGLIVLETGHDPTNRIVRVVIADNGPGIPESEREKLFLPYYSTKRRGSGLGLAIVRRIVAEHGGSIEVSDNVPKGTRFTIELPC